MRETTFMREIAGAIWGITLFTGTLTVAALGIYKLVSMSPLVHLSRVVLTNTGFFTLGLFAGLVVAFFSSAMLVKYITLNGGVLGHFTDYFFGVRFEDKGKIHTTLQAFRIIRANKKLAKSKERYENTLRLAAMAGNEDIRDQKLLDKFESGEAGRSAVGITEEKVEAISQK